MFFFELYGPSDKNYSFWSSHDFFHFLLTFRGCSVSIHCTSEISHYAEFGCTEIGGKVTEKSQYVITAGFPWRWFVLSGCFLV